MVLVRTLSSPKNRGERSWGNWAPLLADRARASKTAKWVQTEKKMSCPVVLVILPRDLSFPRRFVCLFVSEILQFWSQQWQVVSNCSSFFFCFSLFIYLFIGIVLNYAVSWWLQWRWSCLCSSKATVRCVRSTTIGRFCLFIFFLLLLFLKHRNKYSKLEALWGFRLFFPYSNMPFCLW